MTPSPPQLPGVVALGTRTRPDTVPGVVLSSTCISSPSFCPWPAKTIAHPSVAMTRRYQTEPYVEIASTSTLNTTRIKLPQAQDELGGKYECRHVLYSAAVPATIDCHGWLQDVPTTANTLWREHDRMLFTMTNHWPRSITEEIDGKTRHGRTEESRTCQP